MGFFFNPFTGNFDYYVTGVNVGDSIGSATDGSVLFIGSGGVLAEDNTNFAYENTNNTLVVGSLDAIDAISSVTYSGDDITQIVYASGRTINYTYTSGVLTRKEDGVYQWDYTYTSGQLTSTTVTKL